MGEVGDELGKYARLAVLATFAKPKSLSELGLFWYNENGRFYKEKARCAVRRAVNKGFLLRRGRKYKANTERIILLLYSNVRDKKMMDLLVKFWCHPFSQQTYLCCEAMKHMFNNNPERAARSKPSLIINTPLILHVLQEKDLEAYSIFVSSQGLEKYITTINIKAEKNMPKAFRNLKEKTDWLALLNRIVKNNDYFLEQTNSELRIKGIMKKRRKWLG